MSETPPQFTRHNEQRELKMVIRGHLVRAIVAMLEQGPGPPMDKDSLCRKAARWVWGVPEHVLRLPPPKKPVSLSTIYRDLRASSDGQV